MSGLLRELQAKKNRLMAVLSNMNLVFTRSGIHLAVGIVLSHPPAYRDDSANDLDLIDQFCRY